MGICIGVKTKRAHRSTSLRATDSTLDIEQATRLWLSTALILDKRLNLSEGISKAKLTRCIYILKYNIIVNRYASRKTIMHEYGHCRQSQMLGWLYLIVVGLPSILHAGFCRCKNHSYYDMWFERWADKLGGVNR